MPSLIPVTNLMVSFVIRSPTEAIGGARSQSPECGAAAARNRARSRGLLALSKSSFVIFLATMLSHSCFPFLASVGISLAIRFFRALTFELSTWLCNLTGRMSFWICSVPAADAKKSDGASTVTLRILRPPSFTGRVACVHCLSFMSMLLMSVMDSPLQLVKLQKLRIVAAL